MDEFQAKWVAPFYLTLLHANYVGMLKDQEQSVFKSRVEEALSEIDEMVISRLLSGFWREQITGSWFVGLKAWTQYSDTIGNLLIPSRTCYAGQGYCFALACFANAASVVHLTKYLDTYLSDPELFYDQNWAMPALMWVDEQNGTDYSSPYLKPGGLWDNFVANKNDTWDLKECKSYFWRAMNYWR